MKERDYSRGRGDSLEHELNERSSSSKRVTKPISGIAEEGEDEDDAAARRREREREREEKARREREEREREEDEKRRQKRTRINFFPIFFSSLSRFFLTISNRIHMRYC